MAIGQARIRIGLGYDLHRLEEQSGSGAGRSLVLGTIAIEHDLGAVSHSDGDALLHAVTDAIVGALGEPDIGELFPDQSPKWEGADSAIFLREAVSRMEQHGYEIGNLDATVILERPRISPHKDRMRVALAGLLGTGVENVNIKGKTHEELDALGAGRGVAVHAVVLLTLKGS